MMDLDMIRVKVSLEQLGFEDHALLPMQADVPEELKRYHKMLKEGIIQDYAVLPSSTGGGGHDVLILPKR